MSEKLISAKYLTDYLRKRSKSYLDDLDIASMIIIINEAPAVDAVKVVRCKDCEAFYPKDKNLLQHCTRTGLVVHKNDFCSGGERREENESD